MGLNFAIELEQEDDGRWIAEVPDLPGAGLLLEEVPGGEGPVLPAGGQGVGPRLRGHRATRDTA